MKNNVKEETMKYGKGISLLLVDDDPIALDIYKNSLTGLFLSIDTAQDGNDAYSKWAYRELGYDLIVTDIVMPNMDGFGLIKKIRETSASQKFIVLTALDDLNEMREIINLGIEGIIQKPFQKYNFLTVALRIMVNIYRDNILKIKIKQLSISTKDNIELKSSIQSSSTTVKTREPQIKKNIISENSLIMAKYATRQTLSGETSEKFLSEVSYFDIDKMDAFQDKMISCEVLLCKYGNCQDNLQLKHVIGVVAQELTRFAVYLNLFGKFPVAENAALKLVEYLNCFDEEKLENTKRKELMIDALLYLLQDINDWIVAVFIRKNANNINYFDASFANSCMEIEMTFGSESSDEDDDDFLEFF